MDHRHLRILIALDEHRNLARVAEHFHVTPPAISKTLREIERELDAELFDRGPRGVTPTALGACMIRHAQIVMAELANATIELRALQSGLLGSVAVGILPAAAPLLAPLGIVRLKEQAPFVTIVLREGTIDALLPELHFGKLDLVVGTVPLSHLASGLSIDVLDQNETIVAVTRSGHPLVRRRAMQLERLLDYPWIIPPAGTSMGESFRQLIVKRRIELPRDRVESGSITVNRMLLLRTEAVGFFTTEIAEFYAEQGGITALRVPLAPVAGAVGAMWVKDRPLSPSAQLMVTSLREVAAGGKRQPALRVHR
jgi:DNA-binding transcriptional LysR family regulator